MYGFKRFLIGNFASFGSYSSPGSRLRCALILHSVLLKIFLKSLSFVRGGSATFSAALALSIPWFRCYDSKSEFNSSGHGSKAGPGTKCAEMLCFDLLTFWISLVLPVFWCCQYLCASYYSRFASIHILLVCVIQHFLDDTARWCMISLSCSIVSRSMITMIWFCVIYEWQVWLPFLAIF